MTILILQLLLLLLLLLLIFIFTIPLKPQPPRQYRHPTLPYPILPTPSRARRATHPLQWEKP